MQYASATDLQGNAIDVRDPLSAQLRTIGQEPSVEKMVKTYAAINSIFGELGKNKIFIEKVTDALLSLRSSH